jgi:hypothetical protein
MHTKMNSRPRLGTCVLMSTRFLKGKCSGSWRTAGWLWSWVLTLFGSGRIGIDSLREPISANGQAIAAGMIFGIEDHVNRLDSTGTELTLETDFEPPWSEDAFDMIGTPEINPLVLQFSRPAVVGRRALSYRGEKVDVDEVVALLPEDGAARQGVGVGAEQHRFTGSLIGQGEISAIPRCNQPGAVWSRGQAGPRSHSNQVSFRDQRTMIEPEVHLESSSCHLGGNQFDRCGAGRDGALFDRDQPSAQLGFQCGAIGDQRRIHESAYRTIDGTLEHKRTEVA